MVDIVSMSHPRVARRTPARHSLAGLISTAALATLVGWGCAEMRQNMRNEFVSVRGAWFCAKAGCAPAQMQRSSKAHREGDVTVAHGKIANGVAVVFNAGKPPKSFSAHVSDCAGHQAEVPADKVLAPGGHGIAGQADSYAVVITRADYPALELGGACKRWTVTTDATWDKGAWQQKAGLQDG